MAIQRVGFPPQIKYIVWNEGCERFSYYGMRSVLVIFMIQQNITLKRLSIFHKPAEAKTIYQALGMPWRRETRELPNPKGNVVSSVDRVKPEAVYRPRLAPAGRAQSLGRRWLT